jgi:predicted transporter
VDSAVQLQNNNSHANLSPQHKTESTTNNNNSGTSTVNRSANIQRVQPCTMNITTMPYHVCHLSHVIELNGVSANFKMGVAIAFKAIKEIEICRNNTTQAQNFPRLFITQKHFLQLQHFCSTWQWSATHSRD